MSMDLVPLGTMVLCVTPSGVEFYIWGSDLVLGQPITMIVWRRETIFFSVMEMDVSSDSAAKDMKMLIIWVRYRSGPLLD